MIVGIDVGNTAIKWACDANPNEVVSVRLCDDEGITQVIDQVAALLKPEFDAVELGAAEIRIASVNRAAAKVLESGLRPVVGEKVQVRIISRHDIPLEVAVDQPDRVGIDRLVGAFGAARGNFHTAGSHDSDKDRDVALPLVVVDAGTTVTVDLVDADGVYLGGAIIPGLAMQTSALASGTDALPKLDWGTQCGDTANLDSPGKNTSAAIRLGILSSVVGGIERLIRLYGGPAHLVVTGGDAGCIASALSVPCQVEPHLVCRTLTQLPWAGSC
ncbi:type III pantothenate kinase [Neorhodopirellula lusitana]|uniref:type III pantothenate kinase n=1 Tax=Neorhodopirellula lusitana TaxID=445327 RepID=UPI0038512390